jgi:hypothetical protein
VIFASLFSYQSIGQNLPIPEILYYKFNETGTTVTNYASAPPVATATIMGSITQGAVGSCDGALIGSGNSSSTDYLNTGWATNLGSGAWSIVFSTSGISMDGTLFYIFGDGSSNSFRCFTNGVAGATNWVLRGGGLTDIYINGGALTTETTCAFVFDPISNTVKGYLNGVLTTTVAQGAVNVAGVGPFKVMGYNSNTGAPLGGLMEEFMMYNRALTDAEVLQLYLRQSINYITVSTCGSYTAPSGAVFTTTGNYNDTIPNSFCGDSITSIDLTILEPTFNTIQVTSCETYTAPSGAVFTSSGLYNDTISNAAGCDSIITIDLFLNYSTTDTLTLTTCDTYNAPDNSQISNSGVYDFIIPNAAGCDSLIHVDLTILNSTSATITEAVCDSYTAPDGAVYTQSGNFEATISNAAGCDSVISINLTILNSSSATITEVACDSYTAPDGVVYTQSGNFVATISNAAGCDSVISINLTINTVNNTANVNGITITAVETNATYQWIDCETGSVIPNETGASYTATANGSYAVIVTKNECTDTSDCETIATIGLPENMDEIISVYPNPATTSITIQKENNASATFSLKDTNGKVLRTVNSAEEKIDWNIEDLKAGIYFITVNFNNSVSVFKIAKF